MATRKTTRKTTTTTKKATATAKQIMDKAKAEPLCLEVAREYGTGRAKTEAAKQRSAEGSKDLHHRYNAYMDRNPETGTWERFYAELVPELVGKTQKERKKVPVYNGLCYLKEFPERQAAKLKARAERLGVPVGELDDPANMTEDDRKQEREMIAANREEQLAAILVDTGLTWKQWKPICEFFGRSTKPSKNGEDSRSVAQKQYDAACRIVKETKRQSA